MIDKLNIGQKFIITYRPNTHNGEARPKLKALFIFMTLFIKGLAK